ncbi:diacylglycerol kinase family protein [Sinomonas sp. ASV322]|uniref:diacylglycerol/lipid kinase family protein n=1 Tax=Sinomonas sp. ASV322 TaxID=3041920 RepID=UPI0027DE6899|nr:diacylglycerol kinase family protein [Sinomonas sp. ASV322]MDQ4501803.1 diacylglycerol kinase family protein [Sinomonas sp. ASV322]
MTDIDRPAEDSAGRRSFTAVVNPVAGGGRAPSVWAPVAGLLEAAGARVRTETTRSADDGARLASAAAAHGDVVVAVGGDGIARDVAEAVAQADGLFALVAAGRGNGFAGKLGMPREPSAIARVLLSGRERAVDLLDVGGRLAPGNAYSGLDAIANLMMNDSRIPSAVAYRVAPVIAIVRWKPARFELDIDGSHHSLLAHLVVMANSGRYGHGLDIVPDAVLDDGLVHVLVAGAEIPKRHVARFMRLAATGSHVTEPGVRRFTGRSITISADRPVPLCVDGDGAGALPVHVAIRPGALRLISP